MYRSILLRRGCAPNPRARSAGVCGFGEIFWRAENYLAEFVVLALPRGIGERNLGGRIGVIIDDQDSDWHEPLVKPAIDVISDQLCQTIAKRHFRVRLVHESKDSLDALPHENVRSQV